MHASSHRHPDTSRAVNSHFSRRVLAKATAGFAAATSLAGIGKTGELAIAQGSATVAGEWHQPENVGGDGGTLQFEADSPFRAIAPHWSGDSDVNAAVEISVSADGNTFSDPIAVGPALADAGPPDRDGRIFGQLLMTDESQVVRYRPLDANGNEAAIPGLAFTYINAAGGPGLGDVEPASLPDTLSRPPIVTRDQWGASLAYEGWDAGTAWWTPEYQTVEHIIIHHSETPSFRDPLVEIRSIHYYHAVTRGWGDIGYNYLVDYLGNVYEGRKGGENVVGGHAYQYAYGSAGVCSMGSFSLETSTPEAIGALVWICAWAGRNLDPLGSSDFHETPNLPTICAHRDVNDSTCPGDALYAELPYIRWATAEVLAGSMNAEPDASYAPGDVVETAVSNANLRSSPAIDASIEATLDAGTVLTVVEGPTTNDDYTWYRVSGETRVGWLATITFGSSLADPPTRDYTDGMQVEVSTNLLNIRMEPGLYSGIVATMTNGDTATVVGEPEPTEGITWLRIDSALGTGWVAEQYVAPSGRSWISSSFTVGDDIMVSTDALILRTEASTRAGELATLWNGTTGTVVGGPRRSAGITWLQIETGDGTGWVDEQYLSEASSAPPSEARFSVGNDVVIDTDALNLRDSVGVDSKVMTVLWTGTSGTVVDGPVAQDNYNWYQIETEEGTGWVVESFLAAAGTSSTPASGFEPGTAVEVSTDAVNLRSSASTSGDVVTVLYNAETGSAVGGTTRAEGYTWVEVEFGGSTGWVATTYLSRSTGSPSYSGDLEIGTEAEVISDHLNVRTDPSLSGGVVGQLFTGTIVNISDGPTQADGYTWFFIESDTWSGWTVEVWLSGVSNGAIRVGSSVRVFDGELNLRSGPSTEDEIVRILPEGAIVEVLDGPETAEGYDWYRVSSSRYGTGWTVANWLERV